MRADDRRKGTYIPYFLLDRMVKVGKLEKTFRIDPLVAAGQFSRPIGVA
jgi:hypothetical protein